MTVLVFQDHEGDPVAVESTTIVGISVGSLNGPREAGANLRVTLIWAAGVMQPFMVAAPFADVLHRWTESRGESLAMRRAHPNTIGWQVQYPGGVQ